MASYSGDGWIGLGKYETTPSSLQRWASLNCLVGDSIINTGSAGSVPRWICSTSVKPSKAGICASASTSLKGWWLAAAMRHSRAAEALSASVGLMPQR